MQRRIILIFGKTGSGKTTLAKHIMGAYARVVVFDPLREYPGEVAESFDEFLALEPEAREEFCITCRYASGGYQETLEEYEYTARALWTIENVLLVAEETEQFLSSRDQESFLNYLISFGRHKGISIVGVGRRPADIAVKLRAQTTTTISFHQDEPRDIEYLEAWGFDGDELTALSGHDWTFRGENPKEFMQ